MQNETEIARQVVDDISSRDILLRVDDDKIIAENGRLTRGERKALKANRAAAIAYLASSQAGAAPTIEPETPEAAFQRGYRAGIEHAVQELRGEDATRRGFEACAAVDAR
jgi:hypothetical protein